MKSKTHTITEEEIQSTIDSGAKVMLAGSYGDGSNKTFNLIFTTSKVKFEIINRKENHTDTHLTSSIKKAVKIYNSLP